MYTVRECLINQTWSGENLSVQSVSPSSLPPRWNEKYIKNIYHSLTVTLSFVGALLNFAPLHHPSCLPRWSVLIAVRQYSVSVLSGPEAKNILVQTGWTHYWTSCRPLSLGLSWPSALLPPCTGICLRYDRISLTATRCIHMILK